MISITNAYFAGIANEVALGKITGDTLHRKSRKFWLYYIIIILIVCKKSLKKKNYIIVNGKMERKINSYDKDSRCPIYYGLVQRSISELRHMYTVVSEFSILERIKIACRAIRTYLVINDKNGELIYWIDLCFWSEWIKRIKPESIKTYGHFDRLTTEISVLSQIYGYKFIIQQHGILGSRCIIDKKLHCDEVFAFNEIELSNFRKNVIANSNCKLKIKYINTTNFERITEKDNLFTIGIVDQPIDGMAQLVCNIVEKFPDVLIFIMLHPRSKNKTYSCLSGKNNVRILKQRKILDVDVLITMTSTLFWDYIYNGYDKKIIIAQPNSILKEYGTTYKNIYYANKITDVIVIIQNEIELSNHSEKLR